MINKNMKTNHPFYQNKHVQQVTNNRYQLQKVKICNFCKLQNLLIKYLWTEIGTIWKATLPMFVPLSWRQSDVPNTCPWETHIAYDQTHSMYESLLVTVYIPPCRICTSQVWWISEIHSWSQTKMYEEGKCCGYKWSSEMYYLILYVRTVIWVLIRKMLWNAFIVGKGIPYYICMS